MDKPEGFKIRCIKEKFGVLRVYADNCDDRMYDMISSAEVESASTCERCGSLGELRSESILD